MIRVVLSVIMAVIAAYAVLLVTALMMGAA